MLRVLPFLLMSMLSAFAQEPAPPGAPAGETAEAAEAAEAADPVQPEAGSPDSIAEAPAFPRLPQPLDIAPAAWPPEALAERVEATVRLELLVSELGEVLDARVTEPAGRGFDEAALLAVRASRFEPALDAEGQPAPATILFDYDFELTEVPAPSIQGRVREAGVRTPLADLELTAVASDGRRALALTDADGRFTFVGLEPGPWTVVAQGPALRTETAEVRVEEGVIVDLELSLVRDARQEGLVSAMEEITVEAERLSPQITERRLDIETIEVLPGTNGDVVKVVQNLPGVARAPLGIGQLIIRGTAPEDSRFFLDGSPIPLVFHFAGLTSILPSDVLDEVAYIPGNYSVRYGRILGGLVDLRTTSEIAERSGGFVAIDVYQSAAYVEQKVGERSVLSLSGRRSYIDAVLNPILNGMDGLQVQAPRYYDAQARFLHQQDDGTTWDALAYLSDDRFRFLGGEEDPDGDGEPDQDTSTLFAFADRFQRLRLRRLGSAGGDWTSESTLSLGPERRFFEATTESEAEERRDTVALRQEWDRPLSPDRDLGLRLGLDVVGGNESFLFYLANVGPREEGSAPFVAPAVYGELTWRLGRFTAIPGLRGDLLWYAEDYVGQAVDPRLGMRYRLTDDAVLKGAVGKFSAPPSLRQVSPEGDGNPDLTWAWSLQNSLGIEWQASGRLRTEATAFYNPLFDLVVGREDRLRFFTGPPPVGPFDTEGYANDGVGMVCGLELLARYDGPTSVGLATLTLSHSERQDRPDEPEELFAYDQPVVFNALWTQLLPKNWRLGGRVRFSSGNPYTEVVNRYQDLGTRTFQPVYGERSGARLPPLYGIDLRIDKTYTFERWRLETYLDLQNIAFSTQTEVITWTYDYGEEEPITSNPPTPVFGFKGEW